MKLIVDCIHFQGIKRHTPPCKPYFFRGWGCKPERLEEGLRLGNSRESQWLGEGAQGLLDRGSEKPLSLVLVQPGVAPVHWCKQDCKRLRKAFQPEFGAYRGSARVLNSPSNPQNCRKKEKILEKGTFKTCAKLWYMHQTLVQKRSEDSWETLRGSQRPFLRTTFREAPIFSGSQKGPEKILPRAKIVEKCRKTFWHFLTIFDVFFCPARKLSKSVGKKLFDTFRRLLTRGPFPPAPFAIRWGQHLY